MKERIPHKITVSKEVGSRILSILERPPKQPSKKLIEMAQHYQKRVRVDDCE